MKCEACQELSQILHSTLETVQSMRLVSDLVPQVTAIHSPRRLRPMPFATRHSSLATDSLSPFDSARARIAPCKSFLFRTYENWTMIGSLSHLESTPAPAQRRKPAPASSLQSTLAPLPPLKPPTISTYKKEG